jgi:hypothetical protein
MGEEPAASGGQRIGEVRQIRAADVDMVEAVWTIPSSISKNKQSHRVPLSKAAFAILEDRVASAKGQWLFASPTDSKRPLGYPAIYYAIQRITSSIGVMIAGDAALQVEILSLVAAEVNERIRVEPHNWWNVKDVAELYSKHCKAARLRRSETALLAPLGLDRDTFLRRQREMSPALVKQIASELINFEPPSVSTIFAGVDTTGAHIWVAHNANISCQDGVGFAAIGAGYWHADSQLMFAGHTRQRPLPETLLLTYSAKKRAEVAPGVGEGTDMFLVGPALGSFAVVFPHVLTKLNEIYLADQKRIRKSAQLAEKKAIEYVEEITKSAAPKEQTVKPVDDVAGDAPVDKKEA